MSRLKDRFERVEYHKWKKVGGGISKCQVLANPGSASK